MGKITQKLTPCLWFDTEGEAAATFYTSVFPNSRIVDIARYGEAGPRPAGTVMVVTFELDGQKFIALNGGPQFTFSEAISYQVDLGVPFRCPWPGQIFVNGGAWIPVGGNPPPVVPYQIQVVRTMVQDVSIGSEVVIGNEPLYRQVYRSTGSKPLRNPRMTFLNCPTDAANKVPRGAVAVFVPTTTTINFYPSGTPVTGVVALPTPIPMTVPGGVWMPLGYLAEGYFAVPMGPAPLISFEVEIA